MGLHETSRTIPFISLPPVNLRQENPFAFQIRPTPHGEGEKQNHCYDQILIFEPKNLPYIAHIYNLLA
jgi:hypothetical protein